MGSGPANATSGDAIICRSCRRANRAGAGFCAGCGQSLRAQQAESVSVAAPTSDVCSRCGAPNAGGMAFCSHCGWNLAESFHEVESRQQQAELPRTRQAPAVPPQPQPIQAARPAAVIATVPVARAAGPRWGLYLTAVLVGIGLSVLDSQRDKPVGFLDDRKLDLFDLFYIRGPLEVTTLEPNHFFLLVYVALCVAAAWAAQRWLLNR